MNFWRGSLVSIWLMLHLGGYAFVEMIRRRFRGAEDFGLEVSPADMSMIFAVDLLVKYWFVGTVLLTVLCVIFWNVGIKNGNRIDTVE